MSHRFLGSSLAAFVLVLAACPSATPPPSTEHLPPPPPVASSGTTTGPTKPPAPKPEEAFAAECDAHVKAAREILAKLVAVKEPRPIANTLEPYNALPIELLKAELKAEL